MAERTTRIPTDSERESPGLLSLLGSLPCVSQTVQAISTFNLGPVNALLKRAAYLPLWLRAPSHRGAAGYETASELRQLHLATEEEQSRYVGRSRIGGPAADVRFRWRFIPEDFAGDPHCVQPLPILPLYLGVSQRIEVFDWELRFRDGESGFRAYGAGRTLPGVGAPSSGVGLGFVLDVIEGYGRLAGLAGSIVVSGGLTADGELRLGLIIRIMDPTGGLLAQGSPTSVSENGGSEPGVAWLVFAGETDPDNAVTLRISLSEGILGSNVFELLREIGLDFDVGQGWLQSRTTEGNLAGSVRAVLDFNPLDSRAVAPIRTRSGVFAFHDRNGRSLGTIAADMIEGRSLRTRLQDMLLPVFRFAGFGPIQGGTGIFTGVRGIMTMNSVISVQPRTLANLYILRLDDPNGRFGAIARNAFEEGAS